MAFARLGSKAAPAIINTYFHDGRPAKELAQGAGADGVQNLAPGVASGAPSHTLKINGVPVSFNEMATAPSPESVRTHIETALKNDGVKPHIASILASLLCVREFVDADRTAIHAALAGKFALGEPDSRELNVIVNDHGVTVHRRSAWSSCRSGDSETGQHMAQPDLLTVDSGVSFQAGQGRQGNHQVLARPHYWIHSTADGTEGRRLAAALSAVPERATAWDRFADTLASMLGAIGIRFERAENLGTRQRDFLQAQRGVQPGSIDATLTDQKHWFIANDLQSADIKTYKSAADVVRVTNHPVTPILPVTVTQHIASFATPQARSAMLAVSKTFRTGAEQATEHIEIRSQGQLKALKARLKQLDQRLINLKGLSLCGYFTDDDLADLPGTITSLNLSKSFGITPKGLLRCLEVLAPGLTDLDLSHQNLGRDFAGAFAKLPFQRLASLKLRSRIFPNAIDAAGARALAESTTLSSLTSLDLTGNNIREAGAKALAGSKTLSSLTSLDLSDNNIGHAGAQALAGSETLSSLTSLELSRNEIGAAGTQALANSKTLSSLTSLGLSDNNIGDAGTQALVNGSILSSLISLDLRSNKIGNAGKLALANSTRLPPTLIVA